MEIDITYDLSVNNAPAAFKTDVMAAVQYLENEFTNNVTINIDVGYGEIDGQALAADDLGESLAEYFTASYASVRNALIAEGAPGASTLPTSSPDQGSLYMSTAEGKALGFVAANNSALDGYVGFSSAANIFSYANGTAPPSNEYYFIGAVEHEITEDMGRFSLLNYQPSFYSVMDLYRYSSPGVRDLTTGGPGSTAYFSIDDGTTDLGSWNNEASNGDLGDWYGANIPNGGDDAFDDYSSSGVVNIVSQSDITLMNALGWTSATGTPSPTVSYADVLWRNTDGTLAEWLMNGSTIVSDQPPTYQGTAVSPDASWNIVGIGDFGGDDVTNILWQQSTTSELADWVMNGSTIVSSQAITSQGAAVAPNASWSVAGIGDFNGNGDDDILWQQSGTGALAEWLMNGSQISSSATPTYQGIAVSPDASWSIAGIGDFTGNGNDDILWQQSGTGALAEWLMNGGTISSSATPTYQGSAVSPDASWSVAGIGDFTGNGDADILWRQSGTESLVEWQMNGGTISSSSAITYQGSAVAPASSWNIIEIGDFTGTGTSDILWQQSGTGALIEWQMNGSQIVSSQSVTSQGNTVALASTWESQAKPTDFA